MNVSQILRSILGETQQTDAKTLELKVGQIVKGMVLKILANQEAMVNIGGVHVKARLETPLQQGQVTMLQVQPESASGQILLKPLSSSGIQIAEESLPVLLKSLGLPDNPQNRQMIARLHQDGVPFTKSNVGVFQAAAAATPDHVPADEWLQSAVIAFKRGLPVTPNTVGGIRQALFGEPAHVQLQQLGQEISAFLGKPGLSSTAALEGTLRQLLQLLSQIRQDAETGIDQGIVRQSTAGAGHDGNRPLNADTSAANRSFLHEGAPKGAAAGASPIASTLPASAQASALSTRGTDGLTESTPPRGNSAAPDSASSNRSVAAQQATVAGTTGAAAGQVDNGVENQPPKPGGGNAPLSDEPGLHRGAARNGQADPEPNWIAKLLRQVGVDHEQQVWQALQKPAGEGAANERMAALQPFPAAAAQGDDASVKQAVAETLKSMLMQLAASDELPPALKETMQQTVQHITGQQLLLASDRNAMFSHMTLFIPIFNQSGNQTAAVHIQSRKGRKGQIDSSNCRLLFDLRMNELGDTLVDVQVVDKIVSLTVYNDFPLIAQLLELHREEVAQGVHNAGYQFISMKHMPFPHKQADDSATPAGDPKPALVHSYQTKPYKGMDIRI